MRAGGAGGGLPLPWRFPLLLIGMLSLLAAVSAGLLRAGWNFSSPLPLFSPSLIGLHAPLMIGAFFGTVIGLERAVALGRGWGYLSPLAAGLGGLLLVAGAPLLIAMSMMAVGALILTLATVRAAQHQPSLHARILSLAAALAITAPLAWLAGQPVAAIAGWMGFLVLTIAGERLELSRFMPPSPSARLVFVAVVALLVLGVVACWLSPEGLRLIGVALVALAVWLLRQDVARRTVRQQGLTRFIAVCLLSGYAWLLFGGVLLAGQPAVGLLMDAAWHAVFVGFVLAMVFGHAPIIFPAVVRVALPYHTAFYLPLIVLHASLLLRVVGGLAGMGDVRALGAAGNALALALFILTMLSAAMRGRRERKRAAA